MAQQINEDLVEALAARKKEKQALIKRGLDHCRTAEPNHTAFCCQWCTDNEDAILAVSLQIDALKKQLGE